MKKKQAKRPAGPTAREERQARRVVGGIIIVLVVFALLFVGVAAMM